MTNIEEIWKDTHNCSKLKSSDIPSIRSMYSDSGLSLRDLADKFGVKQTTIYNVVKGISWKHVAILVLSLAPFYSKAQYVNKVQRQAYQDLRKLDRITVLVDSLNATIEKYGQLVDQKDRIITSQDSIIAEKSKQEVFYQDIIISKESEIKITTKALKRNAFWNKFFKVTTVLGIGTTSILLITK